MALATTCPQCKTSFRVVPDQLKLRRGFVRCGRCRHVFAGIDHLRYVDDTQRRAASQPTDAESEADQHRKVVPPYLAEPASAGEREGADRREDGHRREDAPEPADELEPDGLGPGDELEPGDELGHDDERPRDDGFERAAFDLAGEADAGSATPNDVDAIPFTAADLAFGTTEGASDAADAAERAPADPRADANDVGEPAAAHPPDGDDDVEWVVVGTPDFPPLARNEVGDDAQATGTTTGQAGTSAEEHVGDEPEAPPYVERFASFPAEEAHRAPGSEHGARAAVTDEDGESAIDYFSTKRSRGFADRRGLAVGFVAVVLAITLAVQWIVAQRSTIASQVPIVAPLLGAALAPFGLRIEAPSELDALTIESFELQASEVPDVLEMRALLRNRADHPVRWPSMQLTLTDPSSRVLVRRTLDPDEYLADADEDDLHGVPAQSEWPLHLALEASDLQLAGHEYRVRLFYP